MSPIGGIIGMLLAETNPLVDSIFAALSGGTFIYVACSEIIVAEFDKGGMMWIKMLMVILGGSVITLLWFIGGGHAHEHGHGDHGHGGHGHAHLLM